VTVNGEKVTPENMHLNCIGRTIYDAVLPATNRIMRAARFIKRINIGQSLFKMTPAKIVQDLEDLLDRGPGVG